MFPFESGNSQATTALNNDHENTKQTNEHMTKYKVLLAMYPDIVTKLSPLDCGYRQWQHDSVQVLSLVRQGEIEAVGYKVRTPPK